MLIRWNHGCNDFDHDFWKMNQLESIMDQAFEQKTSWPRINLVEAESKFILTAEVPGLGEKDVKVTLDQEVLTISGERKLQALEGHWAHQQERNSVSFSRSLSLPCRVNADSTTATVKNGILTVTMEKAAEAMPRQIVVQNAS